MTGCTDDFAFHHSNTPSQCSYKEALLVQPPTCRSEMKGLAVDYDYVLKQSHGRKLKAT